MMFGRRRTLRRRERKNVAEAKFVVLVEKMAASTGALRTPASVAVGWGVSQGVRRG
jgi:hypothetical protein